ncbi:MAG: fused MFS/spermidine synthase [Phycisphaerae bacterium]|nr:fused MFS/spermidine synthase [Phycisphaerae bacterium]
MVPLYASTLFISALLLFLVQPMVGKMVLPKLGGTPAVWNTCMVFFQAMLLVGYAYAHGALAALSVRRQMVLHFVLMLAPLAVLPIAVAAASNPPSTDEPVGWLLWQLLLGVGLPFFVVSSSAPVLQKWFAVAGHGESRDPYFLYAASNAGSLLALVGYPLLVEPHLQLADQSRVWAFGYGGLIVLVGVCAVAMWRSSRRLCGPAVHAMASEIQACSSDRDEGQSCRHRAVEPAVGSPCAGRITWVVLSAIPSSLMLGVTTHITTDLAAIPLMWVLPLAIYLLTFVLVFARRRWLPHGLMVKLLPYLLLPMAILFFGRPERMEWLIIPVHLLTFFVATMVCHGELVRRRPPAERLTEFYLMMSIGGVLGGLLNAMLAPRLFSGIIEYPLMMVLVCFVLPRSASGVDTPGERRRDIAVPVVLAVLVALGLGILHVTSLDRAGATLMITFAVLVLVCFTFKARSVRFGLSYAVMLVTLGLLGDLRTGDSLHAERNFFGVKRVVLDPSGRLRLLVHGTTSHGCQSVDPVRAREPSSYYHRSGPIGDLFAALNEGGCGRRVGVIGLGAGAVAAYACPGQHFTFYEIDPAVERIACDSRYFSFLSGCRGRCDIVLGDGRLAVAAAWPGEFQLFLLDAFSSDSVPTHLLAREAVELYLAKLSDRGMLAFHVSNRFFDFEPLLAGVADDLGLACLAKFDAILTREQQAEGKLSSHCVVMARHSEDLRALVARPGWHAPSTRPGIRVWTDQYCDVVGLFLAGKRLDLGPRAAVASP